jgi:hypothetical protein
MIIFLKASKIGLKSCKYLISNYCRLKPMVIQALENLGFSPLFVESDYFSKRAQP